MSDSKIRKALVYILILGIFTSISAYNNLTGLRLNSLHPVFAAKLEAGIKELERKHPKYDSVEVISGYRTVTQQNDLFNRGKTPARGGFSYHNFGMAGDIAPFLHGRPVFTDKRFYRDMARVMSNQGLETGFNWPKPDIDHVQLPSSKVPIKFLRNRNKLGGMSEVFLDVDKIYGREIRVNVDYSRKSKGNSKRSDCCCENSR